MTLETSSQLETSSWIQSRDLTVTQLSDPMDNFYETEIVIEPGALWFAHCTIDKTDFPNIQIQPNTIQSLQTSTRSCLAQAGLSLHNPFNVTLNEEQIELLNNGATTDISLPLENLGPSRLILKAGDKLGRFYYVNKDHQLKGDFLPSPTSIKTFGTYDKHWWLIEGQETPDSENETLGVAMVLDQSKRFYLPQDGQTIRIASREDIYRLAKPMDSSTPKSIQDHPFVLAQTKVPINLPKGVLGELSYATDPERSLDNLHTNSRLIDPGTNHRVRVEIRGDRRNPTIPEVVFMRLVGGVLTKTVINPKSFRV